MTESIVTTPRRITIEASPSAALELDRMAKSRGQKIAELFRSAMSLMRISVNAAECGMEIHLVDPTGVKEPVKIEIN